jgi:phosphate/phosphite/phosphonate ABC transporter binding protein
MRLIVLLLVLSGCSTAQEEIAQVETLGSVTPPTSVLFDKGRKALEEAGVETLRWGVTPYMDAAKLRESFEPITAFVGERLGIAVELVVGSDYEDLEKQISLGAVDVATVSPYSYVRAKKSAPGLSVFASHIARGSANYGAYIVVGEDSDIESLSDLTGERFAFVDKRSTSGWLFPAARMLAEGIHPERDLEEVFLQTHDNVYNAVAEGRVVGGATYDGGLRQGRDRREDGRGVRVIAKSPRIPHEAYVLREGLPQSVAEALGAALSEISTGTRKGRRLLAPMLGINGFMQVDDSHYDVVRQVETEAEKAGLRIETGPPVIEGNTESRVDEEPAP